MANEKLSQLTAIITPVDTDEMYIISGGISLRISLLQMFDYVEPNLDADFIYFDDPSSNGLASSFVGDALRELDDALDAHIEQQATQPVMPSYDFDALPDPASVPFMYAFATGTSEGDVPVYNNGSAWKYFFNNVNASKPVPQANLLMFDFAGVTVTRLRVWYGHR